MSMYAKKILALGASAAVVASALVVAPLAAAPAQAADAVTITPNPAYAGEAYEGWGTSLVWFANATGNYPAALREDLYQKVFGEDGLDLNIARYNIGGGNASDVASYLRPGGAVEGYWAPNPTGDAALYGGAATTYAQREAVRAAWDADNPASYDFSADETQRWWVERLTADDQISHWETFANSAPYFMTESGYVSGGFNSSSEQLKPAAEAQFAKYLVKVTENLEDTYGISVDTLDPFNEPNTNYWGTTLQNGVPVGGRQEGMHMGPAAQVGLIDDVSAALDASTTDAGLSAMDETNPGIFTTNWAAYPAATRAKVEQLNVHTYGTDGRLAVRDIAKQADKGLWMSEIEGNWVGGYNPVSIENGLGIAGRITDDLRELEPKAWVLWQPVEDLYNMSAKGENLNWGSIFIDLDCKAYPEAGGDVWKSQRRVAEAGGVSTSVPECGVEVNSKFNTIRNYTKFITKGDHLVAVDDLASTAAVKADGSGASVVHINSAASERVVTLDLSRFGTIAAGAKVTPFVTTQAASAADPTGNALVGGTAVAIDRVAKTATLRVPAKSVTSFKIEGVSGVADTAPALRDGHDYQLVGTQSGKALTATGSSTAITTLGTEPTRASAQSWTVHEVAAGDREATRRVVLENADGRMLGASSSGTTLVSVSAAEAKASVSTRWIVNTTDGSRYTLVNEAVGQSLDVAGQSSADNAVVGVYGSNGGANQSWQLRDLAPSAGQSLAVRTAVGTAPTLPASITPQYGWGAGTPVAVTWQAPNASAWATAGRVDVPGTATDIFGQAIAVTAQVDVGGLSVTDPASVTVAVGASIAAVTAAAPTTVKARVGASGSRFDVAVTWDWAPLTAAALAQVGAVRITGTATADGATLPATLTVLVTAGTLRNINPDAGNTATASTAESGYSAERTRNGVLGDKGWSNWVSGTKATQSTLSYTFAAPHEVEKVAVQFYRDGTNSWAQSAQLQVRNAAGAWTAVPGWESAQPVASPADGSAPTLEASFAPLTATGLRVIMNANANTHMIVSEVQIFESVASSAAVSSLAALRLDGAGVAGFDLARTDYAVQFVGNRMPVLSAVATDQAARVQITQPTSANGGAASITVTSADGSSSTTTTVAVELQALPSLDIAATAVARCVAGKVVVTVKVTNNDDAPVTIAAQSAYGSKTFTAVAPGKSASAAFSTRATSIPAGSVSVVGTQMIDGKATSVTIAAPVAAMTCR